MSKLKWDESGKRYFEAGVSKGVLYPMSAIAPWHIQQMVLLGVD